ncbi:MAG TPA: cupin domain-containing protein [Chloroflexota bacterium]|nr:cupin domain-containing protein [Chloroflexota bacterium]
MATRWYGAAAPDSHPARLLIYDRASFSPPLWVYENEDIRIEHQDMNSRQPFYHRNTDVDEISYQVSGPRQLITEIGTVDLEPGDFVNIPVGVAHDNWGRQEIHLLFYVRTPVARQLEPVRLSRPHEFRDWEPAIVPEMISAGAGLTVPRDERLLLAHAAHDPRRLEVLHPGSGAAEPGTRWAYKGETFWLGWCRVAQATGSDYRRHLNFEEVQFQLAGKRTLITEVGCVDLEPGDFVKVPRGVAHTSIADRAGYLVMYAAKPLKRLVEPVRTGELRTPEQIDKLRALAV